MARRKRAWHPSNESDELVYAVCERFLVQLGYQFGPEGGEIDQQRQRGAAAKVAEWVRKTYGREDMNRERIYPMFWEAMRRRFLLLLPPRERLLAQQIAETFGLDHLKRDEEAIQVVNARGPEAPKNVSGVAADVVYRLIHKLGRKKRKVHVALGAGLSSMHVAQRLAQRVYSDLRCPNLVLHALSAGGFLVDQPHKAPITYFSYFSGALTKVEYVGLFSETVVSRQEFERVRDNPGVRESFARAGEIDIVITSLAAAGDPHGMLGQFLHTLAKQNSIRSDAIQRMLEAGWVGDVQFRPYTPDRALDTECPVRVVTLFEIADLVRLAQTTDKYVILVAGPCGECGQPKTEALLPLIENPELRLWTHLVTDVETAAAVLQKRQPTEEEELPAVAPHHL